MQNQKFKRSLNRAKQLFRRSLISIFGESVDSGAEEVVLKVVKSKCLPLGLLLCMAWNVSR